LHISAGRQAPILCQNVSRRNIEDKKLMTSKSDSTAPYINVPGNCGSSSGRLKANSSAVQQ
jgi:hypothetical protein